MLGLRRLLTLGKDFFFLPGLLVRRVFFRLGREIDLTRVTFFAGLRFFKGHSNPLKSASGCSSAINCDSLSASVCGSITARL